MTLQLDVQVGKETEGLQNRRDADLGNVVERSIGIAQLYGWIPDEVSRRRENIGREIRVDARHRVVPNKAVLEAMIVEIDGLQRQRHVRRQVVARLQIKRKL